MVGHMTDGRYNFRYELALKRLGWGYAAIPAVGALLWFLTGDLDDERNRSPLDLLLFVEFAIVIVALKAGLGGDFIAGGLRRAERIALGIVGLAFLAGLVLAAPEPLAAIERMAMRLPHLGAGIGLCYLLWRAGPENAGDFARWFLLQPVLHLPVLALLYWLYLDDARMNWLGGPVGFWHVRVWGMVLAVAIAAAIGLHAVRWERGLKTDLALFGVVAILIALLAWSGSRAAMLGLILSYLAAIAVVRGPLLRGLIPVAAGVALGIVLSLGITVPNSKYGLVNTIEETGAESLDESSGGRMSLWRGSLDLLAERPLTGHGFDQFRYVYTGEPEGTVQPHNAVLQLLVDFGVVGGIAAIFLLLSLWWRAVGDCRQAAWKLPGVLVLNALVVIALFDGALYHPEPLAIIAMCLGILLSQPRRDVA